jgi:RNA polymerase sigma factor (sigma-70 family)
MLKRSRLDSAPDTALWSSARSGNAEAFGVLFERHAAAIYNYCFRRTGNWTLAEDLTSIVFLEAWRRRDKELRDDKVRAWLFGIATFVTRNQWRSVRRHRAALSRFPRERSEPDFGAETDARLDDERRMAAIHDLVGSLPRHERDALALCVWAELSYEEAAAALDVPIGTVRSRLARARSRLRELDDSRGHVGREATTYKER